MRISKRMAKKVLVMHGAMVDLVALMNLPQRDDLLLRNAQGSIDRAWFRRLVGIARYGPIGVGDLADRVGRDHTTVSRQVARLEQLGLVLRAANEHDRRVNEASLTTTGRAVSEALDQARVSMARSILEQWTESDFDTLVDLFRRFVSDLEGTPIARTKYDAG